MSKTEKPDIDISRRPPRVHQSRSGDIWSHPQFLVSDVCLITGATSKALEHFVNPKRELVRLSGPHVNPGTGRRRVFNGGQVLMITAAYAMTGVGFPQKHSMTLADMVLRRAEARAVGMARQNSLTIISYPASSGEWSFVSVYEGMANEPKLPLAFQALDVDRLINEVQAQLAALIADENVPDFSLPDPEPEPNHYSPASNFFLAWDKSESGRWVYVGLTEDETDELLSLQGSEIQGDELVIISEGHSGGERFLELHEKHECVRLARCAEMAGRG